MPTYIAMIPQLWKKGEVTLLFQRRATAGQPMRWEVVPERSRSYSDPEHAADAEELLALFERSPVRLSAADAGTLAALAHIETMLSLGWYKLQQAGSVTAELGEARYHVEGSTGPSARYRRREQANRSAARRCPKPRAAWWRVTALLSNKSDHFLSFSEGEAICQAARAWNELPRDLSACRGSTLPDVRLAGPCSVMLFPDVLQPAPKDGRR